jgi:hypothetical protein
MDWFDLLWGLAQKFFFNRSGGQSNTVPMNLIDEVRNLIEDLLRRNGLFNGGGTPGGGSGGLSPGDQIELEVVGGRIQARVVSSGNGGNVTPPVSPDSNTTPPGPQPIAPGPVPDAGQPARVPGR